MVAIHSAGGNTTSNTHQVGSITGSTSTTAVDAAAFQRTRKNKRISSGTTLCQARCHQSQLEAVVTFAAVQARAFGRAVHNHGVITKVAVHGSSTDESDCETVVRFLSRIGAIQRDRGRTHQAAGDDHRVSTTATDNFAGAQIAGNTHQIIICTAVKRRSRRITTNKQAVSAAVAVHGRGRSGSNTDVVSAINGASTIRRVTAPNRRTTQLTSSGDAVHTESTHQAGVTHCTGEAERVVLCSTQNGCSICRSSHQGIRTLGQRDHTAKAAAQNHAVVAAASVNLTSDHRASDAHKVSASTGIHSAIRN